MILRRGRGWETWGGFPLSRPGGPVDYGVLMHNLAAVGTSEEGIRRPVTAGEPCSLKGRILTEMRHLVIPVHPRCVLESGLTGAIPVAVTAGNLWGGTP